MEEISKIRESLLRLGLISEENVEILNYIIKQFKENNNNIGGLYKLLTDIQFYDYLYI